MNVVISRRNEYNFMFSMPSIPTGPVIRQTLIPAAYAGVWDTYRPTSSLHGLRDMHHVGTVAKAPRDCGQGSLRLKSGLQLNMSRLQL
jgi:hypothetical protein